MTTPETKKKRTKKAAALEALAPEPVAAPLPPAENRGPGESADEEKMEAAAKKPERYFEAVGRRKTAVTRVRVFTRPGAFTVNGIPYDTYFSPPALQRIAEDALKKMKLWERFRISVVASGGGVHAQAEAIRHGLAHALVKFNADFRKRLKRTGLLTRDSRMKERKKFGLKKARRAPQWQKR